jgi:hypothetical protein
MPARFSAKYPRGIGLLADLDTTRKSATAEPENFDEIFRNALPPMRGWTVPQLPLNSAMLSGAGQFGQDESLVPSLSDAPQWMPSVGEDAFPPMMPTQFRAFPQPWPPVGFPPLAPGDVFKPWRNQNQKGLEGFFNYLRRRHDGNSGGSDGGSGSRSNRDDGGDRNYCHERYDREAARCEWRRTPRFRALCYERAMDRCARCVQNGGRPHPNEMPEWGDFDEQID